MKIRIKGPIAPALKSKPNAHRVKIGDNAPFYENEFGVRFTIDEKGQSGSYSNDGGKTWREVTPHAKGGPMPYQRIEGRGRDGEGKIRRQAIPVHILNVHLNGDVNGEKSKSIPMGREYSIHHLDADPTNNHKDNLLLMLTADHDKMEGYFRKLKSGNITEDERGALDQILTQYQIAIDE